MREHDTLLMKLLLFGGCLLFGLYLLARGWAMAPPARDAMISVRHRGVPPIALELIYEGVKHRSSYRTQIIRLPLPGGGQVTVSPPKGLWVDGLDRMRVDAVVQFLIDPAGRIIYEATTGQETLLAFEAASQARSEASRRAMLVAAGVLGIGGFGLVRTYRQMAGSA